MMEVPNPERPDIAVARLSLALAQQRQEEAAAAFNAAEAALTRATYWVDCTQATLTDLEVNS